MNTQTPLAEAPQQNADIHARLGRTYDAGFVTEIESDSLPPGLNEDIIRVLSAKKDEPGSNTISPAKAWSVAKSLNFDPFWKRSEGAAKSMAVAAHSV